MISGQLSISVAAAAIGLNRGIIQPNLYSSFIVLAVTSVFVSSMLFRFFSETERQLNSTTDITWTLPRSQDR